MKHLHIRRFAATGAGLALAATGMAVSMAPAQADSAALNYTCNHALLGDVPIQAVFSAPATVPVGGAATLKTTVSVPEGLAGTLAGLDAATMDGTGSGKVTLNDAEATVDQTIPSTAVDAAGFDVVASGPLAISGAVGSSTSIVAGDFTVTLNGKKADGSPTLLSPYELTCAQDAEQDATVDTVKVVKAKSTTKVQKVKGKKKKAVIKVKVKSETSVKATGKVKVTLKGPKKVTKKVKVNKKGVAKVTVKKLKKGKYKVNAKYLGNKNVKASKGKAKGKVKVK